MPKYLFQLLIFPIFLLTQTLTGTVKDSLGNPFQNANVIAKPFVIYQVLGNVFAELIYEK